MLTNGRRNGGEWNRIVSAFNRWERELRAGFAIEFDTLVIYWRRNRFKHVSQCYVIFLVT